MCTKFLLGSVLVLALFTSPGLGQGQEGRALYLEAKKAYEENHCDKAVPLLKQYLKSYSPTWEMAQKIGVALGWCDRHQYLYDEHHQSLVLYGYNARGWRPPKKPKLPLH